MTVAHPEPQEEDHSHLGLAFLICSALTAGLLLAILVVLGWRVVDGEKGGRAVEVRQTADQPVRVRSLLTPSTTIYVVGSRAEAVRLQAAFEEWDSYIRESGLEVEPLTRVVVAESPEDVLLRRVFDFSFLRAPDFGENFRIIDLR